MPDLGKFIWLSKTMYASPVAGNDMPYFVRVLWCAAKARVFCAELMPNLWLIREPMNVQDDCVCFTYINVFRYYVYLQI